MALVHDDLSKHEFGLPQGYGIVRLQDQGPEEKKKLLSEVFDLIRENYPEWASSENEASWMQKLYAQDKAGTRIGVSAVVDQQGKVVGASALELFDNGTAMINYSIGHKSDAQYDDVIYATTKDMAATVRDWQKNGETINIVAKEHHLDSRRAHVGYYAVGQVPVESPSSPLAPGHYQYLEVAYGDPKDIHDPVKVDAAKQLAVPVNLWLVGDFTPSQPQKPLAESLVELSHGIAKEHSIFRDSDLNLDPSVQSVKQIAEGLPPQATYRQVVEAASIDTARFMGQPTLPLMADHIKAAEEKIGRMSQDQRHALWEAVERDERMAQSYLSAGDDPQKRQQSLKDYPELETAYRAERTYEKQLRETGAEQTTIEGHIKHFREIVMPGNLREGNLPAIERALHHGQVTPDRVAPEKHDQEMGYSFS